MPEAQEICKQARDFSAQVINLDERRGPQLEDGYVRIANELFDAMLGKITSYRHLKVALAIVRKTYGFQKKEDDITISQLSATTGIHRNHVGRTLRELESMGVIGPLRRGSQGLMIGINKHHGEWVSEKVEPRKSTNLVAIEDQPKQLIQATKTVDSSNQNSAHKRQPQKTTPKEGVHTVPAAAADDKKRPKKSDDPPPGFEDCWKAYPKRAGGNSKAGALRAYMARLKSGRTPDEMLAGTKRYAAYVKATGAEGSQYVKQGQTFYGPDEHFLDEWAAPAKPASRHSGFDDIDYREGVNDDGSF